MKLLWSVFVCLFFSGIANAQLNRYVVRFKNKGGSSFSLSNPSAYLSQRAIDRRTKYSIALDSTDLPVTTSYISQVRNVTNVTLLNISKWLNAAAIQTTDANAINTITAFPFVQSVTAVAARNGTTTSGRSTNHKFLAEEITTPYLSARTENTSADYFNYGTGSYNEIHLHNGEFLHNIGLRGQGMQIAMLDNGYNNYTILNSFDSARINNQILGTWDFVNREQNVINDGSHGMSCFSIIAGNIPGQFIGKAPKASFWLFKTEDDAGEYPIEEFFWACGAERADSAGTDILSSSLGYGYGFDGGIPDYVYATLNGNTTMSAIAADLAAKKGVMVFVSAGNAGTSGWHFITTPSDGDSVVCVGAVTSGGSVGSFSSYGPSGDGQIKPDLASVGVNTLVQSGSNTVVTGNGTSYACPNMAGLASCLWQAFPEYNNMKVVQTLKESATKFTTPDDRVGYGIPNVKTAFTSLLSQYATATAGNTGCRITLNWNSKDVNAMKYEIERKAPGETAFSKIGELNATGGAVLSNKNYQYTNDLVAGSSGSHAYRIKQIIDTATATFAFIYITPPPVTVATTDCPVLVVIDPNKIAISLQPNPAPASTVTLIIETPTTITNMPIVIYDGKGSLVMQLSSSKAAGKKTIELPISRLSKGKYYVKVFNASVPVGVAELIRQ